YLTPTKKPIGYGTDKHGRRKRLYDAPATPFDRVLRAQILSPAQTAEMTAYRDSLDPDAIARHIADLQTVLMKLAAEKTDQLYLSTIPSALPDIRKGIRVKAS
ncbi:MAG: integrase, partial [bacterium]|nr:integrase [bacterium]